MIHVFYTDIDGLVQRSDISMADAPGGIMVLDSAIDMMRGTFHLRFNNIIKILEKFHFAFQIKETPTCNYKILHMAWQLVWANICIDMIAKDGISYRIDRLNLL